MSMLIAKLKGGVGNQLFQYAAARGISVENNIECVLDLSVYEVKSAKETPREYALTFFNIAPTRILTSGERNFVIRLYAFINKLINKICGEHLYYKIPFFKNKYLDGYWQSEKYFTRIEETIRREFVLKNPLSVSAEVMKQKIAQATNAISLHIRRGDYVHDAVTNQFHGVCSPEYYTRALEHISDVVGSLHVFIFSDDIAWVKENLKIEHPFTCVSGKDVADYEELVLMSMCKHHIIANSSFSWWGAWLNPSREKIVVAPKQWFVDKNANDTNIIPESWIRM